MRTVLALALAVSVALPAVADAAKLRKPRRGFQMRAAPWTINPGEDLEWCEYRRLPNRKPMDIQAFELRMPPGAHHFVLWAYNGNVSDDAQFPADPVEVSGCTGIGPGDTFLPVNLFGMQTPNSRVRFPKGIATRVRPRQQVWINPHMKNFGPEPLVPEIVFNIVPARRGTVKHYAESFAIGNSSGIRVPAGGRQTLVSEWTAPVNLNIIQLSSHQHQWGIGVTAEIEQDDGTFQTVFENESWEHPYELWTHEVSPWKDRSPPVLRLAHGRRLRFTCRWSNGDTRMVRFGVETTDEMCFVTGYYYRDAGAPAGAIQGQGCLAAKEGLTCPFAGTVASSVE